MDDELDRLRARVAYLEDQVAFWKDQQRFAASVAGNIADLDEQAPALRQMLRREIERRKAVEERCDLLAYRLAEANGALP